MKESWGEVGNAKSEIRRFPAGRLVAGRGCVRMCAVDVCFGCMGTSSSFPWAYALSECDWVFNETKVCHRVNTSESHFTRR